MWLIIILILVGVLFLLIELVLLPGFSVAGICALISYGSAIYFGFERYGTAGGMITIAAVAVISGVALFMSLRSRTWQRLALKESIDSKSQEEPSDELKAGDRGVAVTRLAPSGKATINNKTYEVRTLGNNYVDERSVVEVVDFESFTVIVRPVDPEA